MLPASETFKRGLLTSHRAETRVRVLQPTESNSYEELVVVGVSAGQLRLDGRQNIWRQGSVTLAPADIYTSIEYPLIDIVNESSRIVIERGITPPNLVTEWVKVATLQVTDVTEKSGSAAVQVNAMDSALWVRDYNLILPWSPLDENGAKMTTVDAIKHLVNEAVWDTPSWTVDEGVDLAALPPDGTVFRGSRMNAVKELAKGLGAIVHVDVNGSWVIAKQSSQNDPVASFLTGPNGVVMTTSAIRTRQEQFNAVPLRWDSPEGGGLVFLVDDDPQSPTYWQGPFGKKPAAEQNVDTITTKDEAIEAARAMLNDYRGYSGMLNFQSVHNPLIEPYDRIEVDVLGSREVHVIDALTLPLSGGQMTVETRKLVEEKVDAVYG